MLELNHVLGKDVGGHEIAREVRGLARRGSGRGLERRRGALPVPRVGPGLLQRETLRAKNELVEAFARAAQGPLDKLAQNGAHLDDLALRIATRQTDPYSVADEAARLSLLRCRS